MFVDHFNHFENTLKVETEFEIKSLNIADFYLKKGNQAISSINKFDCGNRSMNLYLHDQAIEDALSMREEGSTTVIVDKENFILAYYTVVPSSIFFDDDDICMCLHISRLATSEDVQERGLGIRLIKDIFNLSKRVGYRFVTLDSLPSKVGWYKHRGFTPFEESDHHIVEFENPLAEINENQLIYMYHDLIDSDSLTEYYAG